MYGLAFSDILLSFIFIFDYCNVCIVCLLNKILLLLLLTLHYIEYHSAVNTE
jgi:hypothetical protein